MSNSQENPGILPPNLALDPATAATDSANRLPWYPPTVKTVDIGKTHTSVIKRFRDGDTGEYTEYGTAAPDAPMS